MAELLQELGYFLPEASEWLIALLVKATVLTRLEI